MTPTLQQWLALGLRREQYIPWSLMPTVDQNRVVAQKSVCLAERWIILYPDPRFKGADIIIGEKLLPQQSRDIAAFLRGAIAFPAFASETLSVRMGAIQAC